MLISFLAALLLTVGVGVAGGVLAGLVVRTFIGT